MEDNFQESLKYQLSVATEPTYLCLRFYTLGGAYTPTQGFAALLLSNSNIRTLSTYIKTFQTIAETNASFNLHSITTFHGVDPELWANNKNSYYDQICQSPDGFILLPESVVKATNTERIRGVILNVCKEYLFWSGYEKYTETTVETENLFIETLNDILECL